MLRIESMLKTIAGNDFQKCWIELFYSTLFLALPGISDILSSFLFFHHFLFNEPSFTTLIDKQYIQSWSLFSYGIFSIIQEDPVLNNTCSNYKLCQKLFVLDQLTPVSVKIVILRNDITLSFFDFVLRTVQSNGTVWGISGLRQHRDWQLVASSLDHQHEELLPVNAASPVHQRWALPARADVLQGLGVAGRDSHEKRDWWKWISAIPLERAV